MKWHRLTLKSSNNSESVSTCFFSFNIGGKIPIFILFSLTILSRYFYWCFGLFRDDDVMPRSISLHVALSLEYMPKFLQRVSKPKYVIGSGSVGG